MAVIFSSPTTSDGRPVGGAPFKICTPESAEIISKSVPIDNVPKVVFLYGGSRVTVIGNYVFLAETWAPSHYLGDYLGNLKTQASFHLYDGVVLSMDCAGKIGEPSSGDTTSVGNIDDRRKVAIGRGARVVHNE